ncbi:MAG: Polyketide cyclase / dehydrase and lipid transport [Nocardioides sp.]|nr:Polyketide cyclase / dehydrase and lipid transport [Nocardioides sp.]
MPTTERSVYTSQPIEKVWAFLSDFTTTEQWDPPTQSTERVEGDGGVGTVYRNVSKVMGRDKEITYTVVEHDAPHRLQLRGDAGRVQFLDTIELQPLPDEVRVHYTVQYTLKGPAKIATPLAKKGMDKVADDAASQMTKVLSQL